MTATFTASTDFKAMRQAMVASQLRTNAVGDPRIVAAMARIPRERFMPETSAALAYRDTAVALGEGRFANLPIVTGRLLTEARLRRADRVLLIGAATGYCAAVLAAIVDHVTAVEVDPSLVRRMRTLLDDQHGIEIVEGPLEDGHAPGAPYDVLVVDGAVERLSEALVGQLAVGGRIVTGLVDRGVTRLAMGTRSANGFGLEDFVDLDCVVLPGFARPREFAF